MVWVQKQKWWLLLNLVAAGILAVVVTQGSTDFSAETFDPLLASGKWGFRFLLLSLAMTPLNRYFGWREAIRLRKPAGLWAFGFTAVHFLYYLIEYQLNRFVWPVQLFIFLGILAFVVLLAMAVTSNKRSMRRLKQNWKRLHCLVYLAGILVGLHAVLATFGSKRISVREPDVLPELIVYGVLLLILLALRLPQAWRLWQKMRASFWQRPFATNVGKNQ
ncbi:sulfite oxidase heme-binding subunit YedZ [Candidatus Leptofilum sp.]|uniref:sulfite oxidase heme-binding subunit YedZ n=1 Tax=Candidatus Leptofilum sp. TaxID=3241576 RepID=UPI003B5C49A9